MLENCLLVWGKAPWYIHTLGIGAVSQSLSCVQVFANSWTEICEALLFPTVSWSLLRFICIELVMLSGHFILCCSFHLLPSIFSSIRVFSSELALCTRWPKYWSFSFRPSNEYSGLISFRIDLFDLLAVQGTLESLYNHHISEASIVQHLAFFTVQLSHLYVTTRKTIVFIIWTYLNKVMLLLFKMLSWWWFSH